MGPNGPHNENKSRQLGTRHHRRVVLLLYVSGTITSTMCFAWMLYFALQSQWIAVGLFGLVVLAGGACNGFARRGRVYAAGAIQFAALYALLVGTSLFLDLPSQQMARTTHLFFLPLGAGAYMGLRGAKPTLRYGIVALLFSTFVVLAATSIGWQTSYALPDEVRIIGGKIDAIVATVAMFLMMHIMQADVAARDTYEADLRQAVQNRQFTLSYQPQVDQDDQVIGAEALIRWTHPRKGGISPAQFIPIAERTGLILPIGEWVLDTACKHLRELASNPHTGHLTIAVNVSAHQIRQADFVVQVLAAIERNGVNPQRLKLELTESVLVKNMEDIVMKMATLKRHGITFALDDFGTGYSSLSYLKQLPLDQLKIDQAFVRDLLTHPGDLAIAKAVVDLGKTLNLSVIAEGVETSEQKSMLCSIGCTQFQGYLFGKPAPLETLFKTLTEKPQKNTCWAAPCEETIE